MKREQLPLIIGLSIPVLLIVVLAAVLFLPRLYEKPTYNFVYVIGAYPTYRVPTEEARYDYTVENGVLSKTSSPYVVNDRYNYADTPPPKFYQYEVATDTNVELSESEAFALTYDTTTKSPDGFTFEYGTRSDSVFDAVFGGGRDSSRRVLEKGSVVKELELATSQNHRGVQFVGWIVEADEN